tara:strand:+ start:18018 stop:18380 length:363 start_codon:yes stop_codon:yes gene_type:complete
MKLIYRLGFYMMGFSMGLIFLAFILKGKKTSCNYGPNDRVIANLSKKAWKPQNKVNSAFDSIALQGFLNKASVDFVKSNTQKDSCKTYFINGYWGEKPISIRVENCEKSVEVLQLNYRSE